MGVFDQQKLDALNATQRIIDPADYAIEALSAAAEQRVLDDAAALSAAQAQIADLENQLAGEKAGEAADLVAIADLQTKVNAALASMTDLQARFNALKAAQPAFIAENLEYASWVIDTKNVGGAGHATLVVTPPGVQSARAAISFPAGEYDNAYAFHRFGPHNDLSRFRQELSFLFPAAADVANSVALEFECQQTIGGRLWNFAGQLDWAAGGLRTYDYFAAAVKWQPSAVKIVRPWSGAWLDLAFNFHREPDAAVLDSIAINGVVSALGVRHPSGPTSYPDSFNTAFQLDGHTAGYAVCLDRMRVTGWSS